MNKVSQLSVIEYFYLYSVSNLLLLVYIPMLVYISILVHVFQYLFMYFRPVHVLENFWQWQYIGIELKITSLAGGVLQLVGQQCLF